MCLVTLISMLLQHEQRPVQFLLDSGGLDLLAKDQLTCIERKKENQFVLSANTVLLCSHFALEVCFCFFYCFSVENKNMFEKSEGISTKLWLILRSNYARSPYYMIQSFQLCMPQINNILSNFELGEIPHCTFIFFFSSPDL